MTSTAVLCETGRGYALYACDQWCASVLVEGGHVAACRPLSERPPSACRYCAACGILLLPTGGRCLWHEGGECPIADGSHCVVVAEAAAAYRAMHGCTPSAGTVDLWIRMATEQHVDAADLLAEIGDQNS